MDEIDALANEPAKPAKPPAKPKTPAPAKPAAAPADPNAPPPEPGATAPAPATSLDEKTIAKMPPQLRDAYRAQNRELLAARAELEKVKSASRSGEDPEKKTLVESVQAKEKRIAELEQELKYRSFEQTDEYKTQYQQPFEEAYNNGRSVASELQVMVDAEEGTTRAGTAEDFDKIMMAPTTADANRLAIELFGTEAPLVMAERRAVILANNRRVKAIEDFRKTAGERDKQIQEKTAIERQQQAEQAKKMSENFKKLGQDHITAKPDLMKADDTDQIGQQILKQSEAVANLLFGTLDEQGMANLPEGVKKRMVDGKLRPEDVVHLHAEVWAKVRSYGFITHKLKTAQARVSELETALAEYEGSVPQPGGGRRPRDPNAPMSVEDEIDSLAAGNS